MSYSTDIPQTLEEKVRQVVEDVLTDPALFLVEVQIRGNRGSRVVEIFVDSDDNLDVKTLADLSREIGFLLDTGDVIDGRYNLNVSSPGVDRPLKEVRQYKKNVGRILRVTYSRSEEVKKAQGALTAVSDEAIELSRSDGSTLEIMLEDIVESKVVLPW